jgi:hypothetical protein
MKAFNIIWQAAVAAAVLAVAAVVFLAGPSRSQPTASLPFATAVTVANSSTLVVAANPSRRGLKICNVGATNDVWIAPINTSGAPIVVAALGAGSFLLSRNSAAAANVTNNCLNMPADVGGAAVATAGFNGITNASTSPVTVWEY